MANYQCGTVIKSDLFLLADMAQVGETSYRYNSIPYLVQQASLTNEHQSTTSVGGASKTASAASVMSASSAATELATITEGPSNTASKPTSATPVRSNSLSATSGRSSQEKEPILSGKVSSFIKFAWKLL